MAKIKKRKIGSWYETEVSGNKVLKRLKESVLADYNRRLERILEWEKEEILREFRKHFKRKPRYSVKISKDGKVIVKTNLPDKEEKILKDIIKSRIEKAMSIIPEVNKVVYESVKKALPENVPKRFAPEKIDEVYEYGGRTLYTLHRDAPIKEVQQDYSRILDLSFKAFKKGVILDTHSGNWTKTKDGRILYVDFEPHSVTLARGLFHERIPQQDLALKRFVDSLEEMIYFAALERQGKESERMINHLLKEIREKAYSELPAEQADRLVNDVQTFVGRLKARRKLRGS